MPEGEKMVVRAFFLYEMEHPEKFKCPFMGVNK
jgi:hypothetical protein